MSFIRPEAKATISRWAETGIVSGLTLAVIWMGAKAGLHGNIFGWGAVTISVLIGGAAIRAAFTRAILGGNGGQRVFAQEGRIQVIGPFGMQEIAIDQLVRVEISKTKQGSSWMLTDENGFILVAPFDADPERGVLDALTGLPNFSSNHALQAVQSTAELSIIWKRFEGGQVEILPPKNS